MSNGDLSIDLALGGLVPASSVSAAQGRAPRSQGEPRTRRRKDPDDDQTAVGSEDEDTPVHELDRLA